MYVAKITKYGLIFHAELLEKQWSEEILSNNIKKISNKNFFFRSSAYKWINSEISKTLFIKRELDIIDE